MNSWNFISLRKYALRITQPSLYPHLCKLFVTVILICSNDPFSCSAKWIPLPTLTGPPLSSPGLAPLSTETPLAHECPPSPRVFTYCRNINFYIWMNVSSEILWIQIVESFYAYHFPELSWMPAQVIPDLVELCSSILDSCPVSYLAFNLHHLFSVHPPKVWNYFKIFFSIFEF